MMLLGCGPLINRWFWVAMKMKENEYQLKVLRKRYDGPFGEVFEWLSGISRDGTLK